MRGRGSDLGGGRGNEKRKRPQHVQSGTGRKGDGKKDDSLLRLKRREGKKRETTTKKILGQTPKEKRWDRPNQGKN